MGEFSKKFQKTKKCIRAIGNVITDPCGISNPGLLIAGLQVVGLPGVVVGIVGQPVYMAFRLVGEIKKNKAPKSIEAVELSIRNGTNFFRALPPQSSLRTIGARAWSVASKHANYANSLITQATFQIGIASSVFLYPFFAHAYASDARRNALGIFLATIGLAYGNIIEGVKEKKRMARNAELLNMAESKDEPQMVAPSRLSETRAIGDNYYAKKIRSVAMFCLFDAHAPWSAGLCYLATLNDQDWVAPTAACATGFLITLARNVFPEWTQNRINQCDRWTQKIREVFVDASRDTTTRRAAAWTFTIPTRGISWALQNEQSPLFFLAAAFACPLGTDAYNHVFNHQVVDGWTMLKNGIYMGSMVSLVGNERYGGLMEMVPLLRPCRLEPATLAI